MIDEKDKYMMEYNKRKVEMIRLRPERIHTTRLYPVWPYVRSVKIIKETNSAVLFIKIGSMKYYKHIDNFERYWKWVKEIN